MNEAFTLTFAAAVPFLCLGLLMLLARLEDTLTDGLEPVSPSAEPAVVDASPAPVAATTVPAPAPVTGPATVAA